LKKIAVVFLFLSAVSLCFANGRRNGVEAGIGYHRMAETQSVSGIDVKTTIPSVAINFAAMTYFTEWAGVGMYGNIFFPQHIKFVLLGQPITVNRSAYDSLWGMDLLAGPVIMLYHSRFFSLPVSFGFHYSGLWTKAGGIKASQNEIGLGANITGNFHFTQSIYMYGRFQSAYDFYSWEKTKENGTIESNSGKVSVWSIEPCLGIGFRW